MGDPGERLGEIWPSSLREEAWSVRVRPGVLRCVWGENGPAATLNGNPIEVSEAVRLLEAAGPVPEKLYPFNPDWTIAPAATLQEWLDENHLTVSTAAASFRSVPGTKPLGELVIRSVLNRTPLSPADAIVLEVCTGVPARMWLALEHNYRAGLAAGLKDMT